MNISRLSVLAFLFVAADHSSHLRAEISPVFGQASMEQITRNSATEITARGYWADHYGASAINLAYNAYIYSYYGRYFSTSNSAQEQNWYGTAATNAYFAYLHSSWAQTYSSLGM